MSIKIALGGQSELWKDHFIQRIDRSQSVCGKLARGYRRKERRKAEKS